MDPKDPKVLYTCNQHLWMTPDATGSTVTWNDLGQLNPAYGVTTMAISADGTMLYTGDTGGYYYKIALPTGSPIQMETPCGTSYFCGAGGISVDPGSATTIYVAVAVFGSPHLWKSSDAGSTWTQLGKNIPGILNYCHIFLKIAYVL